MNPIALISDIQQAFHNIKIDKSHRDVLRFLRYDDILNDVIAYRFARLLFGLTSSPFIFNSTIDLHVNKFETLSPEKFEQFLRDLYIDDSSTSFPNIKDAHDFYLFVLQTLRDGYFSLHKWCTNSKELSELILADQQERFSSESPDKFILDNFEPNKVLGVSWGTLSDEFVFSFKEIIDYTLTLPKTKRLLLSVGAKFLDPLEILCLIATFSKILFQEICSNNFEWDSLLLVEIF